MSEIQHPPIDLRLSSDLSLERVFAEEAYQMLAKFAVPNEVTIENFHITYPATDRYDIVTQDEDKEGEHALRLKGVPVMALCNTGDFSSTDKYYVVELQRGELQEECDMPTDEEFTWLPYVMAVVDKEDPNSVSILDAQTGKDLSQEDLGYALMVLQIMRQEMRSMMFEDEIAQPETEPDIIPVLERTRSKGKEGMYIAFDSAEHLGLISCDQCRKVDVPCAHNPETLN